MSLDKNSTYKLSNGKEIPVIGFGTYQVPAESAQQVVYNALKQGFRHIDSAQRYQNELQVVKGIVQFLSENPNVKREEIFYTTKVETYNHGYETAIKSLDLSFDDAKELGYIDLILIHDPLSDKRGRLATWLALQDLYKSGKVKSIGVSNYGLDHLKELFENEQVLEIKPHVNQISVNPWLYREELINFSKENGLLVEAYSPLTRALKLDDPKLQNLVSKYNRTPVQILTRWSLQRGLVPLVKTQSPELKGSELIESFDFNLTDEDVEYLTSNNSYFLPEDFDPPADKEHLGAANSIKP
ncbi:Aldo-keto reductase family 1 member [Wickerhamomyces ciferrii]|uniref:Aldo-keto reductase family 1 member n=1 Tax=Wickerhamomyces ciferrii (strain ATCC 14091 / BCRC 22168 / CBS 111 / JCM 3599 / NBRC 0793 / NRRL Y-1031 F-60-10) TaxID=1206466 RepID=K0KQN3_WICCF|nr:Aldo-keto reductase family 1 member [Wickerhamomyces ciferrii]CCH45366.1 Aldo-keto reductase family 1 member [Wickerhamomyces ciferrii]